MSLRDAVLITGAGGGIGRALCQRFQSAGWKVVGLDLHDAPGLSCDAFFRVDVGSSDAIRALPALIGGAGLRVRCIVNNAAQQVEKRLVDTTESEWAQVLSTNLGSVFLTTKYFFDSLKGGGSIVNISSVHARATSIGLAAYVASKGGVSALGRAMALELAEHDIRVNAILPGAIDTPMLRKGLSRNNDPETAWKKLEAGAPLRRVGKPEEVAELALFLADSRLSANITGQEFVCDGGVLARLASE